MKIVSAFQSLMATFRVGGSAVAIKNNNSMPLPLDLANKLIEDRVEFKLYAAKQVLGRLKQLEKEGFISSSNIRRVKWEMIIECLLAHLVGSVDALLVRINGKLGLSLDIKYINSNSSSLIAINNKLNALGKGNLLQDLNIAIQPKSWFWILKNLRNQGVHTSLINIHVRVGLFEDIDTSNLTDEHLSTSVHGFHKSNLEKILRIIRTVELYKPGDSVISYWKKSNA